MSQTPSAPFSDDRASQVAAGISLVGALLIALALPLAARLRTTEVPRWLAVAAVALAVLTVLAGLGAVVLRLTRRN
jgi:predicted PurR-regulated permease PerM